ncbi:hypothetical protein AOQ84DRAFT_259372, partial [Glonium stellatum]
MLVGIFLWTLSNTCVRVSVLLLYIRIFPVHRLVIFSLFFIICNVLFATGILVSACLLCRPFAYNWNRVTIQGHCGNQLAFNIWMGIINLVFDLIIVILPMPIIWKLQMSIAKKVSIILIFSMGFGLCIITLLRVIETTKIPREGITKGYASVGVLSILEPLLGIVNCCLPVMRPILTAIRG